MTGLFIASGSVFLTNCGATIKNFEKKKVSRFKLGAACMLTARQLKDERKTFEGKKHLFSLSVLAVPTARFFFVPGGQLHLY